MKEADATSHQEYGKELKEGLWKGLSNGEIKNMLHNFELCSDLVPFRTHTLTLALA